MKELEQSPSLIQYRDEYKQLVATFGLYKGGNATHDRAIFLTLYNGDNNYLHQTKAYNLEINRPRYRLTIKAKLNLMILSF